MDQTKSRKEHGELVDKYDSLKSRYDKLSGEIADKQHRKKEIENYLDFIKGHDFLTKFEEEFWYRMVDFATAYGKDDIRFTMKDGTEIKA